MGQWLTDRSRYLLGLQHCGHARYLRYHSGPSGYGIARKAKSLPLATGTYIHEALADILRYVKLHKAAPSKDEIRVYIKKQIDNYFNLIRLRGFDKLEDEQEFMVKEQCTLVEGLVWGWTRIMLPELVQQFEILAVEQEETLEIDGITQMSKPDFVAREIETGIIGIHDFKSAAFINDGWVDEFRESVQMAVGTLGVEKRLGLEVKHYYIHALVKGLRKKEYDVEERDYSGPKRQTSFLCYGYHRAGNPPVSRDDWQAKFKYKGEDGKNHTLGRNYLKRPIWEAEFEGKPSGISNVEYWVSCLSDEVLGELFAIIGPYERQEKLIQHYMTEMVSEEKRWIERLWRIYESNDDPKVISQEIPRSWNCHKYGSPCEFLPKCFEHEKMWEFEQRVPHHQPEIDQAKSRGVEFPAWLGEAEEDES